MDLPSSNSQEMDTNSSQNGKAAVATDDKKSQRPQPDQAEKCPRCDSGNTKFCYYNNYSLSQPRYFCKACRRYWTKGGTLRNVPVGGGCRKNKRYAKRALDIHHHHHQLLVQSHLVDNNNNNNNNNMMLSSASFDPKHNQGSLNLADHSNYSSPLRYEDSGACDSLSLALATLQRQSNVQAHHPHLGFKFDLQNSTVEHQSFRSSGTNDLGLQSNFFEPQATCFKYSQNLYNYGFENGCGSGAQPQNEHHTPSSLLLHNEDLSLSNMASAEGYYQMKQEMNGDVNGNRILWGLPWQVDNNNNNGVGEVSPLGKNNNLVHETGSNNYKYTNNGYEVEGGGRSESWNNAGLAAASSWPNLINTAALIM